MTDNRKAAAKRFLKMAELAAKTLDRRALLGLRMTLEAYVYVHQHARELRAIKAKKRKADVPPLTEENPT